MGKRELPDILTPNEEKALLKQFNRRYPTSYRNRCMVLLALSTGLRISELTNLQWSDIELDSGRCHIKRAKGEKDRVIFIKPSVLSELVDLADKINDHTGLVFKTLKGQPISTPYLRKMIARKAMAAAIQKRVHFHLLRHTYLTRLYTQTKDLRLVQEVAGHADISTTQIYTHISGEDVRKAMLELK